MIQKNIAIRTTVTGGKLTPDDSDAIRQYLSHQKDGESVTVCIMPEKAIPGALSILPISQIAETLKAVSDLCNTAIDHSDTNAVLELLNNISTWLAYLALVQSSARYYADVSYIEAVENMPGEIKELGRSERMAWGKSKSAEANALYELAQRVSAAASNRCEHLRTFISFEKAQIMMNNTAKSADGGHQVINNTNRYFPI
jgi:hypothetical protein